MSVIVAKIGDICEVKRGTTITQKNAIEGTIPVVAGGIKPTYYHNKPNRLGETITISGSGANAGYVNFWNIPIFASDCSTVQVLRDDVSIHYIHYFLLSKQDFIYKELRSGAAQPHVYGKDIANIEVSVPPIATQKKIVAKLDAIFAEIDKTTAAAEANAKNAEALWQSMIDKVITDFNHLNNKASFSEVVEIKSKLVDPKEDKFQDFLHIGAGNMVSNNGELLDLKTAKEENLISGKFIFDENTVLYSKIRPYLKKVSQPSFVGLCSADVYPLVPIKNKVTKDFFFFLLLSNDFTNYAIAGSDRAGMPKVNREHLFAYQFNLPAIESQNFLTTKIKNSYVYIKVINKAVKKKIVELSLLKQSILTKAFHVKLVKE